MKNCEGKVAIMGRHLHIHPTTLRYVYVCVCMYVINVLCMYVAVFLYVYMDDWEGESRSWACSHTPDRIDAACGCVPACINVCLQCCMYFCVYIHICIYVFIDV